MKSLIFSPLTYLGFRRMRLATFPSVLESFFPFLGGNYRDETNCADWQRASHMATCEIRSETTFTNQVVRHGAGLKTSLDK